VPKPINWIINIGIFLLDCLQLYFYREGDYPMERAPGSRSSDCDMVIIVFYGVLKLRRMQANYDRGCPPKVPK